MSLLRSELTVRTVMFWSRKKRIACPREEPRSPEMTPRGPRDCAEREEDRQKDGGQRGEQPPARRQRPEGDEPRPAERSGGADGEAGHVGGEASGEGGRRESRDGADGECGPAWLGRRQGGAGRAAMCRVLGAPREYEGGGYSGVQRSTAEYSGVRVLSSAGWETRVRHPRLDCGEPKVGDEIRGDTGRYGEIWGDMGRSRLWRAQSRR